MFVERNAEMLALGQANFIEEDRHNVPIDDLRRSFDCIADYLKTMTPPFVFNAAEGIAGAPKKLQAAHLIVSARTGPEPTTVLEMSDDSHLTL
jgi:hypothetical protein